MFKNSFNRADISNKIEKAVTKTLVSGCKTPDLGGKQTTKEITNEIIGN